MPRGRALSHPIAAARGASVGRTNSPRLHMQESQNSQSLRSFFSGSSVQLLRWLRHGVSRTAQVRPSMVPGQVSGARLQDERRRGVCRLPRPTPVRQPPALPPPPAHAPAACDSLYVALLTAACAAGGPNLAARSSRAAYAVPERRAAPALAPSAHSRRSATTRRT